MTTVGLCFWSYVKSRASTNMKIQILFLLLIFSMKVYSDTEGLDLELLELLGLSEGPQNLRNQKISSRNSASRFLREVYSEISDDEKQLPHRHRRKRTLKDDNFITSFDRSEMEKCNNLITFSSKAKIQRTTEINSTQKYLHLQFNMNDIPTDLQLVHSSLRVYHRPAHNGKIVRNEQNATISVYEKITFQFVNQKAFNKYRIVTSLNMTTQYKGWLEFNITRLLSRWLKYRRFRSIVNGSELLIDATIHNSDEDLENLKLGFIQPTLNHTSEQDPFIIGYFNGPQLIEKMKKLRSKREVVNRRRKTMSSLHLQLAYQIPKTCERLNFTVNFKDTHMDSWVIAPKKFEAYFCGGECNFPLGSQMNATNHAIVQTLMQLKQPHLPKPCCAPTALESITILHYLNEDNVNLVKFPQSVVKECGCL